MRPYPEYGGFSATERKSHKQAMKLVVRPRPGHPTQGILQFGQMRFACALGRGGIRALKREGDGATPLATMRLLHGFYRAGRASTAKSSLPFRKTRPGDGWCDAPDDRNYNRQVRLPYGASCETMQRSDRLYDCVIVLDYNIRPRRRGRGSAIFLHIAREGFLPTEGCIAVSPQVMARLLPYLNARTVLVVTHQIFLPPARRRPSSG